MIASAIDGGVSPTSIVGGIKPVGHEPPELQPRRGRRERADAERIEEADDRANEIASSFGSARCRDGAADEDEAEQQDGKGKRDQQGNQHGVPSAY